MELEVTWGRAIRVWWAYLWRNLIAIVAAVVAGGVAGGVLGFVLSAAGVPIEAIRVVSMAIGGTIGLVISVVPIKLILNKDFGEFRLSLTAKQ